MTNPRMHPKEYLAQPTDTTSITHWKRKRRASQDNLHVRRKGRSASPEHLRAHITSGPQSCCCLVDGSCKTVRFPAAPPICNSGETFLVQQHVAWVEVTVYNGQTMQICNPLAKQKKDKEGLHRAPNNATGTSTPRTRSTACMISTACVSECSRRHQEARLPPPHHGIWI